MATVAVCQPCLDPGDRQWIEGTTNRGDMCQRCRGLGYWLLNAAILKPRLAFAGQSITFSSEHRLLPYAPICWDVNGYYRDLGCEPGASRGDLMKAYLALGNEPSARATFCLKQLLDPEIRRRYDACQIGEVFFDDYLKEVVMKRIRDEAMAKLKASEEDVDDLEMPDFSDALNQALQVLDSDEEGDQDVPHIAWGYFLWDSFCTEQSKLSRWRSMIADALWRRGVVRHVAVGYRGAGAPDVSVEQVGGVTVAFISDTLEPTLRAAEIAANNIS